ncbi:MAG: DUF1572 domain-containing protein [Planctomycetota bacterium]|nr:DUF1572 domain-containing protein [Planctomycetota bacterium]
MREIVGSIEGEFGRYKALGEGALRQLTPEQWAEPAAGGNSIATIVWHLAGNLASRFTDFLSSDGEKPWRDREAEFAPRAPSEPELFEKWNRGWDALGAALRALEDADLNRSVTIRNQPLAVHAALHRSLAHVSYHVGQIVLLARAKKGAAWAFLSIPPGGSADYNRQPAFEKPDRHARKLRRDPK